MDFFLDLLKEAIFIIVPAIGGYFLKVLIPHIRKMQHRKAIKFDEKTKEVVCYTANSGNYDDKELVTLGYTFEYMASGTLMPFLKRTYKNCEVPVRMAKTEISAMSRRELRKNLIVIGGPFHNVITQYFVFGEGAGVKLPFYYQEDATLVYDPHEGEEAIKRYSPVADPNGRYFEQDYTLILNLKNPLNPSNRMVVLIGCRSVGTYAGALFFTQGIRKVKKYIKDEEYAVVVSCEADEDEMIGEPQFVEYFGLDKFATAQK